VGGMGSDRARETVRRLQHDIVAGRWPIGSSIPNEVDLAAEMGVGRSTIREAVRSLAHLGMLEPAPGRGTFVRSLNPVRGVLTDFAADHTWADILAVRKALEVQAAQLVASSVDAGGIARLHEAHRQDVEGKASDTDDWGRTPGQFHGLILELAGNHLLAELYSALVAALRRGVRSGHVAVGQDDDSRHREHAALLAAVEARNPVAAAALAASHADHDLVVVAR
jgi:DNA-binding FadR family transcriptional regulator